MMRPLIAAVLALGAVFAVQGWKAHIYAQGDAAGAARVQKRWDADTARRDADTLAAHLAAQQVLRTQEAVLQQKAERIAHETAQREAQLRSAVASADARADVPGTSTGACAAPGSDAAATARELLGACSQRYAAVAAAADQLGGQVTGLQDYVRATAQAQTAVQTTGDDDGF